MSDALTEIILDIFRVNGKLLTAGDRLTKPFGQTSSRWQVLGAIEKEALTVPQIARVMGISRQSVQRTADLLVSKNLCEYQNNPHHKSSLRLSLTKSGRALLSKISKEQTKWVTRLAEKMSVRDLAVTRNILRQLEERLSDPT